MIYTFPDGRQSPTFWEREDLSTKRRTFHMAMCHLFDFYTRDDTPDIEQLGCDYYDLACKEDLR